MLDRVRDKICLKNYSIRTEQLYTDWIKHFILHFGKRHPSELGAAEVEGFLTHLAVHGRVAASTQNQARCCFSTKSFWALNWRGRITSDLRRPPSACPWY
ncbi:MAG: phage integrase N-terminal SAM-like domain-containing protein [Methylococcales bacterium]